MDSDFLRGFVFVNDYLEGKGLGDLPRDKGGMTWCGIARNFHPQWSGWITIDDYTSHGGHPQNAYKELGEKLKEKTQRFFYEQFWVKGHSAKISEISANAAIEVYDVNVNAGSHGVRLLQRSLNLLNRNQKWYEDIEDDDSWGPNTERCLRTYLRKSGVNGETILLDQQNHFQWQFLTDLMMKDPNKKEWGGWFLRSSSHMRWADKVKKESPLPEKPMETENIRSALLDIERAEDSITQARSALELYL